MTSDEKRTKPSKIRLEFYESVHPNQPSSEDLAKCDISSMQKLGITYYTLGVDDDELIIYEGANMKPFLIEIS